MSTYECKECYDSKDGIASFCKECNKTWHSHHKRDAHHPKPIIVPREYSQYSKFTSGLPIEKHTMELFAVICIATSHYVAFVKCGLDPDSPWCFFDSMADRKGEIHGMFMLTVRLLLEKTWCRVFPNAEIFYANQPFIVVICFQSVSHRL